MGDEDFDYGSGYGFDPSIDFMSGSGGGGGGQFDLMSLLSGGTNPMYSLMRDYQSGLMENTPRAPTWMEQIANFGGLPDRVIDAGGFVMPGSQLSQSDAAAIALGKTPGNRATTFGDWGRNAGYGLAGLTGVLGLAQAKYQYDNRKDDRNRANRVADSSMRAQDYALSRTQQQDSRADQMTTAYNDQAMSNAQWRPTTRPDGSRGYVNTETGEFRYSRPTTAKPVLLAQGGLAHLGKSDNLPGAMSDRDQALLEMLMMQMLPGAMSDRESEMLGGEAPPYGFETLRGLTEDPEVLSPEELNSIHRARGGRVSGPGMGQEDAIDARLSAGEYIFDASTVSDLGDGSTEAGAKALDKMVKTIRREKRGGLSHLPPKAKSPTQYLKRRA